MNCNHVLAKSLLEIELFSVSYGNGVNVVLLFESYASQMYSQMYIVFRTLRRALETSLKQRPIHVLCCGDPLNREVFVQRRIWEH